MTDPDTILAVLDACCDDYTFPMLDNGYVYLAACRLTLFRSSTDWALVTEVFGFSPRAGLPDTHVSTFASRVRNHGRREDYVSDEAYDRYLATHQHSDSRFVFPIDEGDWLDEGDPERVAMVASHLRLRGEDIRLPQPTEYAAASVSLETEGEVRVFELCRWLAHRSRAGVLATPGELRENLLPDMEQVLQLDSWHHPDVVEASERPSGSETFQQLARVLATGEARHYQPSRPPNTHWSNWPNGGTL